MLYIISNFLKHTALKLFRDPKDFIKILEIFKDFLKNDKNFEYSSRTKLEDKEMIIDIPLTLSSNKKDLFKQSLSKYPSVFQAGIIKNLPGEINLINALGQFLTIIQTNIDSILVKIELHNNNKGQHPIDIQPFEELSAQLNSIWGKIPFSTNAKTLAKKYHEWPHAEAAKDLQEKIEKTTSFLEGPFIKTYEKIKDIPE